MGVAPNVNQVHLRPREFVFLAQLILAQLIGNPTTEQVVDAVEDGKDKTAAMDVGRWLH